MPYFYLYDTYTSDKSHVNTLVRVENALTDLGIQGRVARLTILKSAADLVEGAIKDGIDTIIAVGNDLTISKILSAVLGKKIPITLGLIPIGDKDQTIAEILGIPKGVLACHVLSSRIIETLDTGKINNQYFIRSVVLSGKPKINCDGQYSLIFQNNHHIKICNLDTWKTPNGLGIANPKNNLLEIVLEPPNEKILFGLGKRKKPQLSQLTVGECIITSGVDSLAITVDGERVLKTPVTVSNSHYKIRMIVGKKRLLSAATSSNH